ncbi:MAG: 2-oxoacid:acceptor oxidoreductase family protein [bacterium]|nr:2-oxoacid:acceptor oxidoreductase family protein [bacterium]
MKNFNIIIIGTGGQGQITLLQILAQAARSQNFDVKTSELHGLSQKGGPVEVHLRFGKEISSPLISEGEADLIISLEKQESLRACYYASKQAKTSFLVNDLLLAIPNQKPWTKEGISETLKKFSEKVIFVPAAEICRKEFNTAIGAGIFLISLAAFKNILPLKPDSVKKSIQKNIKAKYLNLNLRIFELARKKAKDFDF